MRAAFVRCASVLFCCLSWPFAAKASETEGAQEKAIQEISLVLQNSKDKDAILGDLEALRKQVQTRGVMKGPAPTKLSDLDEKTQKQVLALAERIQKEAKGPAKGDKADAKGDKADAKGDKADAKGDKVSFIDMLLGVLWAKSKKDEGPKVNTPNAIAGVRG